TRDPFILLEDERTGTDIFLDLLRRRRLRHSLRHHETVGRTEGIGHLTEALLQPDLEALVVQWLHLVGLYGKLLAKWILGRPALDRCRAIDSPHGLPIAELQPIAQRERPGEFVAGNVVPGHHLRLANQRIVDAV